MRHPGAQVHITCTRQLVHALPLYIAIIIHWKNVHTPGAQLRKTCARRRKCARRAQCAPLISNTVAIFLNFRAICLIFGILLCKSHFPLLQLFRIPVIYHLGNSWRAKSNRPFLPYLLSFDNDIFNTLSLHVMNIPLYISDTLSRPIGVYNCIKKNKRILWKKKTDDRELLIRSEMNAEGWGRVMVITLQS